MRMRIIEYVASSILEGKLGIPHNALDNFILSLENQISRLSKFVIIRIYNVARLLKIKETLFTSHVKHYYDKNEAEMIENLSRTRLKKYSLDLIQYYCRMTAQKLEQPKYKDNH